MERCAAKEPKRSRWPRQSENGAKQTTEFPVNSEARKQKASDVVLPLAAT